MAGTVGVKRVFTDKEVRSIREEYAEGRATKHYQAADRMTYKVLAEQYGVTIGAIAHMVTRKTYAHIQ